MLIKNPFYPTPAPPNYGGGREIPERDASIFSRILLLWLSPILKVGFSRPLEQDDLWSLPPHWLTNYLTDELELTFYSDAPVDLRPLNAGFQRTQAESEEKEKGEGEKEGEEGELGSSQDPKSTPAPSPSLPKALHRQFFWRWWLAGLLTLISQTLTTTTPLLNRVLLTWLVDSYVFAHLSAGEQAEAQATGFTKPRGIGYGIGLAFALFAMQEASSLITAQSLQVGMSVGLTARSAVIGCITRKSLRLSGRARSEHPSGQILTMISTDVERIDAFCALGHHLWVAPIQIIVAVGLLIHTLGYSALVGLGVLILSLPIQTLLVVLMFTQRKKGVKITDSRVRLTTEVLQGIRLLKLYAWEKFYVGKITDLRKRELETIRKSMISTACVFALMALVPVLASVLSFVTYALTGHDLDIAIIFTLQFFNLIQIPLVILPITLASLSSIFVAFTRITKFLLAEDRPPAYELGCQQNENAIECEGDFVWDVAGKNEEVKPDDPVKQKEEKKRKRKEKGRKETKTESIELPTVNPDQPDSSSPPEEQPFQLQGLKLTVPKGAFVAIVGRVGSGKSSILQALIGEMRKTSGQVRFGGSVAYVPQHPWIRNASVRENIMFGRPEDKARLSEIFHACSLTHDLNVLSNGEHTQIGERGINISGGQKARVSLARAAYSDCDIALLDDPLSAVDSHVGKDIMENCILSGPLSNKTRVLVTHALHFLDKTDYIYVIQDGSIKEEGTYKDLVNRSETFDHLMKAHGQKTSAGALITTRKTQDLDFKQLVDDPLIQVEERNTGAVTWTTYKRYFASAGGLVWVPIIFSLLIIYQACQVGTTLLLGFWTAESIPGFHEGDYIALYASFGAGQAIFSFMLTWVFAVVGIHSSLNLFTSALKNVLASPISFFDTTPLGRILSRLSKDQDTLDTILPLNMMQFLTIFSTVIGTVALVFYTFPLLGIIFAPMSIIYWFISAYYRRTSVEIKRLDSLARSNFYSSFSETLTGIATVRAYRDENRSMEIVELKYDLEGRAYYITISLQRWLILRLDLFANVLILGIALFAAGFRNSVNPSKIGVVLSYSLSVAQLFSQIIYQFTQNEQNMNAVERLLVYTELPSEEAVSSPPVDELSVSWPAQGEIEFKNVDMAYREGLPLVLKDVSFHVEPREKIGIVGRTGAGKSTLLQALLRVCEIRGGSIKIDGRDISSVDLETLRIKLALVPQDSTLFLGTLRQNLDPLGMRTDAELISVLQRACLLPKEQSSNPSPAELRFSLDSEIGDEGSNFSAGEKQLLALCRALVKNSQIIILDEATSSVDVETDVKIQQTIQSEFASSTLLCIAHRIHTVVHYNRILVMDLGKVAEYGTVLDLYDREESIFRSLCNESGLSRADIVRLREAHKWVQ